jgi:hypothetical protein
MGSRPACQGWAGSCPDASFARRSPVPNGNLVASVVKQALLQGGPVELDGLGSFVLEDGQVCFRPETAPRVFIAYVCEDATYALRLASGLESAGMKPWVDRRKLLPGQDWRRAIERAIETADFFVPCLSSRALQKRGQFPYELRFALRWADRMPLEQNFIAPVRIDDCNVPAALKAHIQYVDLFPDWNGGLKRLTESLWQEFDSRS